LTNLTGMIKLKTCYSKKCNTKGKIVDCSTLRGWGPVIISLFMEVIICTPAHSRDLNGLARGCYQGDAPKSKEKQKQKQKTINFQKANPTQVSLQEIKPKLSLRPSWVGGFVALGLGLCLFVGMPQASAASLTVNNVELAKKVIEDVKPVVIAEINKDQTANVDQKEATLVTTTSDFIQKPLVVETIVTPVPKIVLAATTNRTPVDYNSVKGPHYFPYGYCTYYVSQKRTITWSGNAGTWLSGAKSAGVETGNKPKAGAIVVTAEGGKVGHVAYVESVDGDQITLSEMNFKGYGIVSSRTIPASSKFIRGYIY